MRGLGAGIILLPRIVAAAFFAIIRTGMSSFTHGAVGITVALHTRTPSKRR
jgi:hypothetical protein